MTFNVLSSGDSGSSSTAMENWRHINYGSPLMPVNSTGVSVDSTIDIGSSTYYFKDSYIDEGYFSQKIGVGETSTSTELEVHSPSGNTEIRAQAYGGIDYLQMYRSSGTKASPTIIADTDIAGIVGAYGYDGSSYISMASIRFRCAGTPGTNDMPGDFSVWTTPDGGSAWLERLTVDSAGNVGIGETSPEVLLHTKSGSGGAVSANANGDEAIFEGSGNTGISILCPATATGNLLFGSPTDNDRGYVAYDHNSDEMKFGSGGSNQMTLDANGNLTITNQAGCLIVLDGDSDKLDQGESYLSFDSEVYDNNSCWASGDAREIYAPISGVYIGTFNLSVVKTGSPGKLEVSAFRFNSADTEQTSYRQVLFTVQEDETAASTRVFMAGSFIMDMNAGDYIKIYVEADSSDASNYYKGKDGSSLGWQKVA
jgi:hypothetical protein